MGCLWQVFWCLCLAMAVRPCSTQHISAPSSFQSASSPNSKCKCQTRISQETSDLTRSHELTQRCPLPCAPANRGAPRAGPSPYWHKSCWTSSLEQHILLPLMAFCHITNKLLFYHELLGFLFGFWHVDFLAALVFDDVYYYRDFSYTVNPYWGLGVWQKWSAGNK